MSATCVLQTRVDEKTKQRAQKAFKRRGMTVSEGLRLALDHEIRNAPSAADRLDFIFTDADKKCEAAGLKEPTIDSIVNVCDDIKQERAQKASELKW